MMGDIIYSIFTIVLTIAWIMLIISETKNIKRIKQTKEYINALERCVDNLIKQNELLLEQKVILEMIVGFHKGEQDEETEMD